MVQGWRSWWGFIVGWLDSGYWTGITYVITDRCHTCAGRAFFDDQPQQPWAWVFGTACGSLNDLLAHAWSFQFIITSCFMPSHLTRCGPSHAFNPIVMSKCSLGGQQLGTNTTYVSLQNLMRIASSLTCFLVDVF
jgi:hypothetical protein